MFKFHRGTREQALGHRELVDGKRGLPVKAGWGSKLKSIGLNLAVGLGSAIVGTSIYDKMTASKYPPVDATAGVAPSDPGVYTDPPAGTYGPMTYGPTYGPPTYGPPTAGTTYEPMNSGTTYGPTTSGTTYEPMNSGTTYVPTTSGTVSSRAITRRARKKHALDGLSRDIFTRSNSGNKLNSRRRTPSHPGLSNRADLERAIRLFSRMLDELD